MKKIIFIFLMFILMYSDKSMAWAVTGPASVCANGSISNSYTLTGNPIGTTIMQVQWFTTLGAKTNNGAAGVTITWFDQCPTTGTLSVDWVQLKTNSTGVLYYVNNPFNAGINISVQGLGLVTPSPAWNCAPYLCSTTNITYSINTVCGATNYQWQIPVGWTPQTPLSGPTRTSITVTPNAGGTGVISVTAYNTAGGCNLSRTYSCNISRPIQAPQFSTTIHGYCLSQSQTAQFCVTPVPNATAYNWVLPNGWTGLSLTNCITVNFNGITSVGANILCRAYVDCGFTGTSAYTAFNVATYATITPYMIANITVTPTPNASKKDINISFAPPPLGCTYNWYVMKPNNSIVNGTTPSTVSFIMTNGQHFAYGIDVNGPCGHSDQDIGWQLSNGVLIPWELYRQSQPENSSTIAEMSCYPNPVSDKLTIDLKNLTEGTYQFLIMDVQGRAVYDENVTVKDDQNQLEINTNILQDAIYNVRVSNGSTTLNSRIAVCR